MRALTLTQPWCGLVASGIKLIENRPRSMIKREDFGVPFALHASRQIDEDTYEVIKRIAPDLFDSQWRASKWARLANITSAVIGVATIERVIVLGYTGAVIGDRGEHLHLSDQARWFFGPVGYVLRDVRALATPVPCRGWQGFWTLTSDLERAVAAQL